MVRHLVVPSGHFDSSTLFSSDNPAGQPDVVLLIPTLQEILSAGAGAVAVPASIPAEDEDEDAGGEATAILSSVPSSVAATIFGTFFTSSTISADVIAPALEEMVEVSTPASSALIWAFTATLPAERAMTMYFLSTPTFAAIISANCDFKAAVVSSV